MKLHLSKTSSKILGLLFGNKSNSFYVNEIVRETNIYPNSVQRSLKTLENQEIVLSEIKGNKKFYSLNNNYKYLSELRSILGKTAQSKSGKTSEYVKWVNRECSVALNAAIGSAQSDPKYIKRFRIEPVEFLWYNSITGGVYNSVKQISRTGDTISREVKKDTTFAKALADSCIKDGKKLIAETQKTIKKDLPKLTEKQLYLELNNLHELFLHFMPYYVIPHAIEKAIEKELEGQVIDLKIKEKLIEPVRVLSDEQADELKLTFNVKKDGWTLKNKRELAKLTEKYCWLPMMSLHHKPFEISHFKKIIDDLVVSIKQPEKELNKLKKEEQDRAKKLKDILNKIEADKELRNLVGTTQAYLNLRTYRVNVTKKFHFYHLPLLYEIAKRIDILEKDIAYLTYYEILDALKNMKQRNKLNKIIRRRKTGFVNVTWKGKTKVISGVKNIVQAMEHYNIFTRIPTVKKEVKGNPACKGIATGSVRIVNKLSELKKVKDGDVLVAKMTTPDYMIAINKSKAIVTDEGGITCHAAIVSREFNIPCIVGTKNATQVLSDGDVVEVNADEGIVRLVESAEFPEDVKELYGSTIYKGKVKGTARVILDASDFDKLGRGDVVITAQVTPEYLSLLYRAKGFVVDEESISSHAVLYGRALKIPSIMGTSFSRNVIGDGERVELDATNGVVKRLRYK